MPSSIRSLFVVGLLTVTMSGPGCQRDYYYQQADEEATALITEKSADPRWGVDDFDVQIDPRSRFANEADPVRPPMPPDDPSSNQLMQSLAGMEGYAGWGANGMADVRENPQWREQLREYMELDQDGRIRMDLEGAIRMSMIHSPDYQATIETLYLSALDVSTERFRFDVQFFGGNDTNYTHRGDQNFGGESNSLTNGSNFRVRRRLATAGQIVVDFANTFTWQFAGPDSNAATSLLGFSIVQPLLRSGGRVVGLEQLTRAERTLLANMRAFQRYRKGFYTDLAIGSRGSTSGPRRSGGFFGGTGLTGFSGQGSGGFGGVGSASGFGGFFGGGATGGGGAGGGGAVAGVAGGGAGNVGGYIGLLQSLQQLRNAQDNLALQQRTLALLQALREAGQIGADQVLSFEQSIETGKANMLQSNNGYKSTVENFVMSSFGLPGTVEISLDDTVIRPFQFIDPRVTAVETSVSDLVAAFGLIENPTDEQLNRTASHARKLHEDISGLTQLVVGDLDALTAKVPVRAAHMADEQKQQFAADRAILAADLKRLNIQHEKTRVLLESVVKRLATKLDAEGKVAVVADLIAVNASLAGTVGEMALVQAGSRLEAITLDRRVELSASDALEIARSFRLDWMNARASLVDGWRLVEYNANALESDLSIVFSGDMKGDNDNPLKLEGAKGTLRAGLQFDAPLTRLLERNNFRQQLINYEQSRRGMITYEDGLRQSFRVALRTLGQREQNLEIQRRAVKIAIRRVDQTRQMLTKPPAPGQPAVLSPTATQDLLSALAALRESQNNFMSVWLAYYAGRMSLMRDLGVMRLDENGIWIDEPLEDALDEARKYPTVLPPAVPEAWLRQVEARLETVRLVPGEHAGAAEVESESDDTADAEDAMVGVPDFLRPGKLTIKKPVFLDRLKQKWNDTVRPIRRASRTASVPQEQPPLESLPVREARPVLKDAGVGERKSSGEFQPRRPRPLRGRESTQDIEVPPVSAPPPVSGAVVPTESYQLPQPARRVKPVLEALPAFLPPRIR